MNTSITYELASKKRYISPDQMAILVSTAIILTVVGTVIFAIVFLCITLGAPNFISSHLVSMHLHENWFWIALLILFFNQLDVLLSSSLKGIHAFRISSILEVFIRFYSLISIGLVAWFYRDVYEVLITVIINLVISCLLRLGGLSFNSKIKFKKVFFDSKCAKELLAVGKWMTLQSVAGTMYSYLDKILVGVFFGNESVGFYNILITFTQIIHFIPASILSFIMPKVSTTKAYFNKIRFIKTSIYSAIASSLIFIIIILLKKMIFSHFHIDYSYENLFYILALCFLILSYSVPAYYVALGLNLSKIVSLIGMSAAFLGIASMYLLMELYGLWGLACSRILYSVLSLSLIYVVAKRLPNHIN
jgi:O-antigen/teichoic acid export membrane protein